MNEITVYVNNTVADVTVSTQVAQVTVGYSGPQGVSQTQLLLAKDADNAGITKGAVYYLVGSDGSNVTVRKAQGNSEANSSNTIGVAIETTSGGSKGNLATSGTIYDIDTSTLAEGQTVYLSPTVAGGMTTTKPVAPNHDVIIGRCIRQHATTGVLFIAIRNGWELDELHNVLITNPTNGQVLQYDGPAGLWENYDLGKSVSYTPSLSGSGWDIGNGTFSASYIRIGNFVQYRVRVTFGSTSTFGAGAAARLSLPFQPAAGSGAYTVQYYDVSTPKYYAGAGFLATTTDFAFQVIGTDGAMSGANASAPFTWASGDQIMLTGSYQAVPL